MESAKVIRLADIKTSPQKENGYTAIANELMDALAKYSLPGAQMQCLLLILRKTYGFNKKTDAISLSQFQKGTGISKRNVIRALDQLKKRNIIFVKKGGVKNDTLSTSKYRFNKRSEGWKSSVINDTGGVKRGKKRVSKMTHTKDNIQKKNLYADSESAKPKKDFYLTKKKRKLAGKRLESFNRFWDAFNLKQGKADAADAWLDIDTLTNSIVEKIITAAKIEAERRQDLINRGQTPKWAQGWITARRWEDEAYQTQTQPDTQIDVEAQMQGAFD